jgi:hypothetical protein
MRTLARYIRNHQVDFEYAHLIMGIFRNLRVGPPPDRFPFGQSRLERIATVEPGL